MKSKAFSANAIDDTTNKRYQLLLHEIGKLIQTNPTLLTQQLAQFKVALPATPSTKDLIKAVSTTIQHNKAFASMVWNDIVTMEGGTPTNTPASAVTNPAPKSSADGMHNAGGTTGGGGTGNGGTGQGDKKHHKHHKKPQHSASGGWKNAAGLGDILAYGGDAVADMGKLFGGNNQAAANTGGAAAANNQAAANAKNQAAQDAIAAAAATGGAKKSNTMLYVGIAVVLIIGGVVVSKMIKKGAAVAAPAAV